MGKAERIKLEDYEITAIWESEIPKKELADVFKIPESIITLIKQGKFGSKITKELTKPKPVKQPPSYKHLKKLTTSQALYAINSAEPASVVARKLKVSANTIGDLRSGRTWKTLALIPRPNYKKLSIGCKGEKHGRGKLTEAQVKEIIKLFPSQSNAQLALLFNVGETTISQIRSGKNWTHITKGTVFTKQSSPKGEQHPNSKITEDLVRYIRSSDLSSKELSIELGLNYHTVWAIRRRINWKHI